MDSPQIRPPDPDQLFSKPGAEPAGPAMVGARNVDSVLFNIKDLDATSAEPAPEEEAAAPAEAPAAEEAEQGEDDVGHSGLIDVAKLVPESSDGNPIPQGPPPRSLVAEMQSRTTDTHAVVAPQSKTQTYILVAAILALLGVAVVLALEALG